MVTRLPEKRGFSSYLIVTAHHHAAGWRQALRYVALAYPAVRLRLVPPVRGSALHGLVALGIAIKKSCQLSVLTLK